MDHTMFLIVLESSGNGAIVDWKLSTLRDARLSIGNNRFESVNKYSKTWSKSSLEREKIGGDRWSIVAYWKIEKRNRKATMNLYEHL